MGALLAYGIAFGPGVKSAIEIVMSRGASDGGSPSLEGAVASLLLTFIGLWIAGMAAIMAWPWSWPSFDSTAVRRRDSPRRVEPPSVPLVASLTAAYMLATYVASEAVQMISQNTGGSSSSTLAAWPQLITAVAAGVGEEILVVAVPVAALALITTRWWIALPVLVTARLAYHVYYGWPVLGLMIWATVAAAIIWRWRSPRVVVAFIAAHIAWDAALASPAIRQSSWFFLIVWCIIPLLVLAGTWHVVRRTRALAPIVGYTTDQWITRHRSVG